MLMTIHPLLAVLIISELLFINPGIHMSVETSVKNNTVKIEIDTQDLSTQQVRLLRSINTMMLHVLKAEDEEQYFEGSAELLRMCAALVSQAHFNESSKNHTSIPYSQQALEYAMDIVVEYIEKQKVVSYDN